MTDDKRLELFQEWKLLGEKIKSLGGIVQNPLENVSYKNFEEEATLYHNLEKELENLFTNTQIFLWSECAARWKENGELGK